MVWFGRVLVAVVFWAGWCSVHSATPSIVFEDVSARSGMEALLRNGATAEKHQIETMVGGVAVIDFDNDGYPDLFFTNGAKQPSLQKIDPSYYNRLYRNLGDWRFVDVTEKAGGFRCEVRASLW